jgi:hypothetical protein
MLPAIVGLASGTLLLMSRDATTGQESKPSLADLPVPLPMLTHKQWLAFLKVSICGKPHTVNPSFRLGTFGFSVRRLCDLGVMKNPRVIYFGERQVWDADWQDPKSLRDFQRRPMLQYDLFVRSNLEFADLPQVKDNVGRVVDDIKLTLSGLLMLAHRAGLNGLNGWLSSVKDRERFADNTTAFVKKANGIF